MKKLLPPVFFLLIVYSELHSQQVGIKTTNPDQALDVNGKIKLGDDARTPTAGTIRYNFAAGEFEGFDGVQWKVLTNKPPAFLYFEQFSTQTSNIRDAYVNQLDQVTILESGSYFIQYYAQLEGLFGNTISLPSDIAWDVQLIRDRAGVLAIVDAIFTSANDEALAGGGVAYDFHPQERAQSGKYYPLQAGDKLFLRYRVSSNPGFAVPTTNYQINRTRLFATRVL